MFLGFFNPDQASKALADILSHASGKWKDVVPLPDLTLEKLAVDIEGDDKEGFLRFLRRILRWLPEERPTAEELVFDPWLMEGLGFTEEQIKELRDNNQGSEEESKSS